MRTLIHAVATRHHASETELATLLLCQGSDLACLYETADQVRRESVGDAVFLRGIIEFSNHCRKSCAYCGIRAPNREVVRYRMPVEEIIETACEAERLGNTSVVLQSGEDAWFTRERLCGILEAIKGRTNLAITLSVGVRPFEDLSAFRSAGCDRYLLRFETSQPELFAAIHPDETLVERVECLHEVRRAGIQVGSGFMIGLPGGDTGTLARDLLFATQLKLDMIGCGPFLSHPLTPLAGTPELADREIYFKTIALLRLLNPRAHIPATTAFDALMPGGRDQVLVRGANVFMPNVTPVRYRAAYQLYPNKPCVDEDSGHCAACVAGRLRRLGRTIGKGPGHSLLGATAEG